MSEITKIHLLQNEATPHNNKLIYDLSLSSKVSLRIFYARDKSRVYSWKEDISSKFLEPVIYGDQGVNLSLLFFLLKDRKSKIVITGWENTTLKALVFLSFLTRRRLNIWLDAPESDEETPLRNGLRRFWYAMCRRGPIEFFCVDKQAVEHIESKGIPAQRIHRLPVSVYDLEDDFSEDTQRRLRALYDVSGNSVLIVGGSRLVYEKGFDILITAVSRLKPSLRQRIKLLLFGAGPEEASLSDQITALGLDSNITLVGWLDVVEMRSIIFAADFLVHPARWDAFAPGPLNAISLGTAVIASTSCGSGPALIDHEESGLLYEAGDVGTLTQLLETMIVSPNTRASFAELAKKNYDRFYRKSPASALLDAIR